MTRETENAELLERLTEKRVSDLLGQRRVLRFSGELAVKYQIHEGVIQRVHIDGHEIIDGESLRKAMTAT